MAAAGGVGNLLDLSSCYNDNGCVHALHGILMRGEIPSAIFCARQSKINEEKSEAGGQGEFSVGLAARRDVASQPATYLWGSISAPELIRAGFQI
jgi:hypothetical protein